MKIGLMPADAAAHGPAFDREMHLALWILVGLTVLAHLVLFLALRARRRETFNRLLWFEVLPLLVITGLFVWMSLRSERVWTQMKIRGADFAAMQVEVTGTQFVWYFRYPGADGKFGATKPQLVDAAAANPLGLDSTDEAAKDDRVSSELVLPVNHEVDLRLRSLDVIHGFSVPAMRIKQNAVPGQVFHIHFTPVQTGSYAVLCTQVCGLGHYRMTATVRVVTDAEYAQWLTTESGAR